MKARGISMDVFVKSTMREIKNSMGRYLAILVITALGVGFFAGLRICRPSFIDTVGQYFEVHNFYDYRLLSPAGFPRDSFDGILEDEAVSAVEGAYYEDVLIAIDENDLVFRVHSITSSINKLQLVSGRLPDADGECVVDADFFDKSWIGQTIRFSASNNQDIRDAFRLSEFTVVGTVTSPLYISGDRGTASLGDGSITAFLFVDGSCFTADDYKELYVALKNREEVYSDAYQEILSGREQMAQQWSEGLSAYLLTRDENAGYAAFGQDSAIIENISVVFPVFFFLVAALVCATTMTRMVDEQRTQIGVWKAMGYGKGRITCKYLIYASSAGLVGSIAGFFAGTSLIPVVFWYAYHTTYNFAERLLYVFDWKMFVVSLAIAIICTAGVTLLCCRRELRDVPAAILRPKSPKSGKRIFLERFGGLWQRASFLHKVSLRNTLRYKQRFFLMVLGISGCTALLLTGFGIRDSIQGVTDYQYGEIMLYDAEITFYGPVGQDMFLARHGDGIESVLFLSEDNIEIELAGNRKSARLTSVLDGDISDFFHLQSGGETLPYPQDGGILLCRGIADRIGAKTGDTVVLVNGTFDQITVNVEGIFDNYIGNYLFVPEETLVRLNGEAPANAAYVNFKKGASRSKAVVDMLGGRLVSHVALNEEMQEEVETSFASLDLVVLLIILCAGILAFIVLFNLININIGERIREIATLKVLGFFQSEYSAYVFREVDLLAIIGAFLGLVFGKFLHTFVMEQIHPDNICFDSRVAWDSYLYSVIITLVFAGLVKLAMRHKLKRINMAESLKSVE